MTPRLTVRKRQVSVASILVAVSGFHVRSQHSHSGPATCMASDFIHIVPSPWSKASFKDICSFINHIGFPDVLMMRRNAEIIDSDVYSFSWIYWFGYELGYEPENLFCHSVFSRKDHGQLAR